MIIEKDMARIQKDHPLNHLWKVPAEPGNISAIVNQPLVTT